MSDAFYWRNPVSEQEIMLRFLKRMLASRKRTHASKQRKVFAFGVRECERLEKRNLLVANNVFASGVSPLDADSAQITGTLWNDVDGNGIRSVADTGLSGWRVFLDSNRNGSYETGEPATTTCAEAAVRQVGLSAAWQTENIRSRPPGFINTTMPTTRSTPPPHIHS